MHMATALLVAVTLVQLLHSSSALTEWEVDQFKARTHTERNTGLQGFSDLIEDGDNYMLVSNGIPDHDTGEFPTPGRGNPHSIVSQNRNISIPKQPAIAKNSSCLPMGPIAYAINGVAIFSYLDSQGNNAVEGERFDDCNGHPNAGGTYHYHQEPVCLLDGTGVSDEFIGVALDGFPIYGNKDFNGNSISSTDLDNCHGRIERIRCKGKTYRAYRYRVTYDKPYILGCFRGTPSQHIPAKLSNNCTMPSEELKVFKAYCRS